MFHLKLDLSISLLYFWLLRRKPTAVTVDHFGLCLTFCRQAKPFGVTLNHFTFRWVDWCDTIPLRLTINHLPITWAISHHSEPFVSSHSTKVQLAEPFVISALNHFSKHLANLFFFNQFNKDSCTVSELYKLLILKISFHQRRFVHLYFE